MMKKANKLSTIMLLSIWALVPLVRAKDDSRQDVDCVPCDMLFTKLHESPTSASKRVQHVQMQLRGEPSFFPPEVDNTSLQHREIYENTPLEKYLILVQESVRRYPVRRLQYRKVNEDISKERHLILVQESVLRHPDRKLLDLSIGKWFLGCEFCLNGLYYYVHFLCTTENPRFCIKTHKLAVCYKLRQFQISNVSLRSMLQPNELSMPQYNCITRNPF